LALYNDSFKDGIAVHAWEAWKMMQEEKQQLAELEKKVDLLRRSL
jgi:hypothetical protein